jgi:hypothetical protein
MQRQQMQVQVQQQQQQPKQQQQQPKNQQQQRRRCQFSIWAEVSLCKALGMKQHHHHQKWSFLTGRTVKLTTRAKSRQKGHGAGSLLATPHQGVDLLRLVESE